MLKNFCENFSSDDGISFASRCGISALQKRMVNHVFNVVKTGFSSREFEISRHRKILSAYSTGARFL